MLTRGVRRHTNNGVGRQSEQAVVSWLRVGRAQQIKEVDDEAAEGGEDHVPIVPAPLLDGVVDTRQGHEAQENAEERLEAGGHGPVSRVLVALVMPVGGLVNDPLIMIAVLVVLYMLFLLAKFVLSKNA